MGFVQKLISKINKVNPIKMVIAISTIAITILNITQYEDLTEMAKKTSQYINFGTSLERNPNINQNLTIDSSASPPSINNANGFITQPNFNIEKLDNFFTQAMLSKEIVARITGKSFIKNEDIGLDQFRYIKILFYGFDGETKVGELIVNEKVAEDVLGIFKDLYLAKYPIEKVLLIDESDASDLASMEDNNTSAFCYREITGGGEISLHALGLAIDINPVQNPYLIMKSGLDDQVLPKNGAPNLARDKNVKGLIIKDDPCYKAFIKRGWKWGGEWENPIDYQHFYKEITD